MWTFCASKWPLAYIYQHHLSANFFISSLSARVCCWCCCIMFAFICIKCCICCWISLVCLFIRSNCYCLPSCSFACSVNSCLFISNSSYFLSGFNFCLILQLSQSVCTTSSTLFMVSLLVVHLHSFLHYLKKFLTVSSAFPLLSLLLLPVSVLFHLLLCQTRQTVQWFH